MAVTTSILATPLLAFLIFTSRPGPTTCQLCEGMMSYQLQLSTYWSKETFHKQYPTFRPHAQWSRLIGRSHNGRYSVWSEGKVASEAMKEFTEQGLSTGFDVETQGTRGIFDTFVGPNVPSGVGSSTTKFLAHSNYNKLSFVVRMIPSPDWFVGVDSLELCARGHWISEKTVDLRPLDSGTDKGFSFTAPNWSEDPQKPIFAMTPTFPRHPASSFYYPEWKELPELPKIAQLKLTRISVNWRDNPDDDPKPPASNATDIKKHAEGKSSNANRFPSINRPAVVIGSSLTDTETHISSSRSSGSSRPNATENHRSAGAKSVVSRKYVNSRNTKMLRSGRTLTLKNKMKEGGADVDCVLGEWSDWSACSRSCGLGVRVRRRSVVHRRHHEGRQCPPALSEEQRCRGSGDAATCGGST